MLQKEQTAQVLERLREAYPDARPGLNFSTPFELLIATILSAQCTDVRVNKVTPALFAGVSDRARDERVSARNVERVYPHLRHVLRPRRRISKRPARF